MVSALIQYGLVNTTSQCTLAQSFELIMTLVEHYVTEEKVVKRITGEIVLDLRH